MIGNVQEIVNYLITQDRDKTFEIKEFKQHRTLSQNAYAWKLINELANKMQLSKEDMYMKMLKDYGQSEIVSMLSNINPNGYFKYFESIGTGIVNNKEFTHYRIYKGSSEYTTLEMKYFIDGIVQECENVGIPTLTPNEIERMKLVWTK